MSEQSKSCSDGSENRICTKLPKSIVGACSHCGSPIYGYSKLLEGDRPETVRSCNCYVPIRNVQQTFLKNPFMETKEEGMQVEGK